MQGILAIVRGVENVPDTDARRAEVARARESQRRWRRDRRMAAGDITCMADHIVTEAYRTPRV